MNDPASHLAASPTTDELFGWWSTLTEDQQDLLRITASAQPLARHVMDFLAWSNCPLARLADGQGPGLVTDPDRLTGFIAHA
jgi:hypothetical protein